MLGQLMRKRTIKALFPLVRKRLEEISTHVAFCSSDPMEFTQL